MARAVSDAGLRARLDHAIDHALAMRAERVAERSDWEQLRERAATDRAGDLRRLPELLSEFETAAVASGARVHWARDAREACERIGGLLGEPDGPLVKSKSMVTEEIGLRGFLAGRGIEVVETDLGEYIVQLLGGLPSHIVAPAIHLSAPDIALLFRERLGLDLSETASAREISLAAREHLRAHFLRASVGMCGANFLAAREGAVVVCTNEGNAGLCTALPRRLIVVAGIDRVWRSLEALRAPLLLLGSSATGQRQTCYTRVLRGPRECDECDGPERVDIVLVDNGRSALLAEPRLAPALSCIRCGACMYVCPVYRRTGGQAYGWMYPGPIGLLLAPFLGAPERAAAADACSLCGACAEVCPMRIDLPSLVLELRAWQWARQCGPSRAPAALAGLVTDSAPAFGLAGAGLRALLRSGLAGAAPSGRAWHEGRELPASPRESFDALWRREEGSDA